jgi:hypothetical protein
MRSKNQLIAAALTAASLTTFGIAQESRKPEEPKELYLYFSRSAVYNHSVGNDFICAYTLDGEKISSGQTVSSRAGETVAVSIELTEQDKHPDTGYGQIEISIEAGAEANTQIQLTENHGRYKGNTALMSITARVIEK